jgi:hypothetical protein
VLQNQTSKSKTTNNKQQIKNAKSTSSRNTKTAKEIFGAYAEISA